MDELELIFNFGTFLYILVQQYTAQQYTSTPYLHLATSEI